MGYSNFTGIVIRGTDYLESDRLLTLLTFEAGKVTVKAKGVRKKGAKLAYGASLFFCGRFECVSAHGRYVMTGVERLYDYSDIALDIDKFYHACHYADIASSVIMEDHPDEEMLRLFLNTLHILVKNVMDPVLLTAVYGFRTAAISGLAPVMEECAVCGKKSEKMVFSYENQGMVCCCNGVELEKEAVDIIRRICEGDMRDLFSIKADRKISVKLAGISKRYIEEVMDRRFDKLKPLEDIYKGEGL